MSTTSRHSVPRPRPNRRPPRWYTLPVVREIPLPPAPAGTAW
jgi:hypothetical protein